jgi:hypothetical protein
MISQYQFAHFYDNSYQTHHIVEKCKAINNEDTNLKIQFLLSKARSEPFPGL